MLDSQSIPSPLETLDTEKIGEQNFNVSELSPEVRGLISSYEVPEFITDFLADRFNLSSEQQRSIARFIMEAALGTFREIDAVGRLAELAELAPEDAISVIESIEERVLVPNNLTLSALFEQKRAPTLVRGELGETGLKYSSLDNLIADIELLSPEERKKFLNDAMPFNRIFVLQAYSQLKMKTDVSGLPLSFRTLVAQEIPTFRTQDWIDLIRVDPDAIDEPNIWSILQRTALGAMLQGRDGVGRREIAVELESAPEDAQGVALSPKTGETIDALAQAGILPSTHTVAAGRVMYFLCIGTLRLEQATAALEKIGLPPTSAEQIASKLGALLPTASAPETPARQQPAQLNVPSYASRNIIDLRNRPTV